MSKRKHKRSDVYSPFEFVKGMAIIVYGPRAEFCASRLAYFWRTAFPDFTFAQTRAMTAVNRRWINLVVLGEHGVPNPRDGDVMAACRDGSELVFRLPNGKVEVCEMPELVQIVGGAPFELGVSHV